MPAPSPLRARLPWRMAPLLLALAGCGGGSGGGAAPDGSMGGTGGGGQGGGGGAAARPVVVIDSTLGRLVVQLEAGSMPITTANFLRYVDAGFYDGTLIHRVVDDWVIQGGGYGPGLAPKVANAPIALETSPSVLHVHGAISMARNLADPGSATSQWFICDWPNAGAGPAAMHTADLDGKFAAFGVLIEGFDVLEAITKVRVQTAGTLENVPMAEIVVSSVKRR